MVQFLTPPIQAATFLVLCTLIASPCLALKSAFRNSSFHRTRIGGGTDAAVNEFPFMVAVRQSVPTSPPVVKFICAGAIVHPKWFITSASWVPADPQRYSEYQVVVGEYQLGADDIEPIVTIHSIYKHQSFVGTGLEHNLALVQIVEEFPIGDTVQTIQYDPPSASAPPEATVAGWGTRTNDINTSNRILQKVTLSFVPAQCQASFGSTYHPCTETCYGGDQKGICPDDAGSPLFTRDAAGQWHLHGVALGVFNAAQNNCGSAASNAGVFARMPYYFHWIKSTIKANTALVVL